MAEGKGLAPLAGSFLPPFPGARPLASESSLVSADFDVSVRLRRKSGAPALPDIDQEAAKPFGQRKWPGRSELANNYGADQKDLDLVVAYAKACGLKVNPKLPEDLTRRLVTLTGKPKDFERAFGIRLSVATSADGETFRVREGEVQIPIALQGIILGIFGLDERPLGARGGPSMATPATGLPTPQAMAAHCGWPTTAAKNQCIALMEFGGGYLPQDIKDYFTSIAIKMPVLKDIEIAGQKNDPKDDDATREVVLDIDIAGAVAGSAADAAKIAVYFSKHTERGWIEAIATAVHDDTNKPTVISISWGAAELAGSGTLMWSRAGMKAMKEYFEDAVYAGVTVLAASGDHGSDARVGDRRAHVVYPASDIRVIGCGGTSLARLGAEERAWAQGGGGISDVYERPTYQAGVALPRSVNTGANIHRGVPDIGGYASPGYVFTQGGNTFQAIGTSLVAPLYAAMIARINATLGTPVGYILPDIYKYPVTADIDDAASHTIWNGYNYAPGYYGADDWDARTGLGVLDAMKLADALKATMPTPPPKQGGC